MHFIILLIPLLSLASTSNGDYTTNECSLLGFNKANLLCSSCDQLKKFQLTLLREHCLQCCQMDQEKSIKMYAKARLEVCTCKFGAYPQIQAFIKSDRPNKYPNLTIRYVRGLDPIIKLMDNNGNVQEVLAIERWDTDTVDEFLSTHLERSEDDYRSNLVINMTFNDAKRMRYLFCEFLYKYNTTLSWYLVLAIEPWNTDTVNVFLDTHL